MHTTKDTKKSIFLSAAQLDLFYDGSAHVVAAETVFEISADEPCTENVSKNSHFDACWPENAQLDLFINTPFDQALTALRRALLNNELDQAAQFYQAATELDATRRRQDSGSCPVNALSDAHICLQLLQTDEQCISPRAVWARLNAQDAALHRFFGHESTSVLHKLLRRLAACPELEVFDPLKTKAYAAQIWFDLDEPELAKSVLERDAESLLCPLRLHLWTQVTEALAKPPVSQRPCALHYWQALCFEWPEHAEEYLSQSSSFTNAWAEFCDLDEPQAISNFPGFASLHNFFSWPQPEPQDTRPCAELIRVALALNANRACVPLRLTLKAMNPALFQDWMARRSRAS